LLQQAGYQFEAFSLEISEIIDENLNCFEQSLHLARLKMRHFRDKYGLKYGSFGLALTCDTMVEFEGQTLGKPSTEAEALSWLVSYSQKRQSVHTGCCLLNLDGSGEEISWAETTEVFFGKITEENALNYLSVQKDAMDKAGAYGLQDEAFPYVEQIRGSYTNVVGLPMESLKMHLKKITSSVGKDHA